jgi:hypothetical protein
MIINAAKNVLPSNNSIVRCVDSISSQIEKRAIEKLTDCVYLALTLDESKDIVSVAQLMCFVRCTDADGSVKNLFLTVLSLSGMTEGEDIYNALMEFMKSNNIDLSKLMCMVVDGVPSCVGKNKCFINLLNESESISPLIDFHCLILVESLC